MSYVPPKHPLEILQKIEFEDAITPDDPRFVETEVARGSPRTLDRLAKKFGLNLVDSQFFPASKRHALLFGHIGCGKSTELLHLSKKLRDGNTGPKNWWRKWRPGSKPRPAFRFSAVCLPAPLPPPKPMRPTRIRCAR